MRGRSSWLGERPSLVDRRERTRRLVRLAPGRRLALGVPAGWSIGWRERRCRPHQLRDRPPLAQQAAVPPTADPGLHLLPRSDTSPQAGRLYDFLAERWGDENVFKDVDSIDGGHEFPAAVVRSIRESQVLLALIGQGWAGTGAADPEGRIMRLGDWVRRELETALEAGVPAIPVHVGTATLPVVLPSTIDAIKTLQAMSLREAPTSAETCRSSSVPRRPWLELAPGVHASRTASPRSCCMGLPPLSASRNCFEATSVVTGRLPTPSAPWLCTARVATPGLHSADEARTFED